MNKEICRQDHGLPVPPFAISSNLYLMLPPVKTYRQDVDADEYQVEYQMPWPSEMRKDPAAGTGDFLPEMQQRQYDVACKKIKERRGQAQTRQPGFGKHNQGSSQQLGSRQNHQQCPGYRARKRLPVKLYAEHVKCQQLHRSGIHIQHDEQSRRNGTEHGFHGTKIKPLKSSRTVAKG